MDACIEASSQPSSGSATQNRKNVFLRVWKRKTSRQRVGGAGWSF